MTSVQVQQSGESQLTRAERDVLAVLLTGAHNRQIAEQLFVTEATVRTHLTHIYSKLEVDGRAALIATFRPDGPLPSSEPLPTKPGRGIQPWIIFGVGAAMIVWFVMTLAFINLGGRAPSWAPISAPAVRVVVGPDATAPGVRVLEGRSAPVNPRTADAVPVALPLSTTAGSAAVLVVLGGCALLLTVRFRRFGPTRLGGLRPR